MTNSIQINPKTGLKIFDTRAARANNKIIGKGYSTTKDQELKSLPPPPKGAVFNAKEQARYRKFKESRRGAADYIPLEGDFSKYLEDVYSASPVKRSSLKDECEVLVVGAGFAGLLLWQKLKKEGFTDIRFCEKGGDVGGTWYWNRYPGIACDVESYSYLPLLEEMNYIPTMKFASGFEIMEYCQKLAKKFNFYDHCLFHTTVNSTIWDESRTRWMVKTDRGDEMKARFVVLANGILTTPKLARIKGMEKFKGSAFHTSRWNYDIDLTNKRVGIIGTGATAVQVVPELTKIVKNLFVFQRTPSSIDVRDQRETSAKEIKQWSGEVGWAVARRERLSKISSGRTALKGNDDFLSGKIDYMKDRKKHSTKLTQEQLIEKQLNSNFRIMEQIRARVDSIVEDPDTASALKPYYPYGCKRPTFHDEFLPVFNQPHVKLVDTAPLGVTEINENGIVHNGTEYAVDVLVYATGFQWMATSTFNMIKGTNGRTLKDKWDTEGTKTFLGLHSKDFPNLFIISGPQGGGGQFNFTRIIEAHTDYVVWMFKTLRDKGATKVDITSESENQYAEHCKNADIKTRPLRDCISYYNGHGTGVPGSLAYYGGAARWHQFKQDAQDSLRPYIFDGGSQ